MNDEGQNAAIAAVALILMDDDDDEALELVMNVANLAALEWMAMDGDDDIGLYNLRSWQHVTVNINEFHMFNDFSFRLHFRMSRRVFENLVQTVGNDLVQKGRLIRERTPLQDILLMVLWIMATPDTFRSVALRFGVNPGTLYYFYSYIIQTLRELSARFITWPSQEERNVIKNVFLRVSGFPNIVGCIDGTHVFVTKPVNFAAQHKNRCLSYSLNVQAVVDINLLVRDLYVGEPGSMNDKRVFRRSVLCRDIVRGQNNRLNFEEHLVGDGGYTLTDFMLIPYANNGHLTEEQLNYNRRLSQCRVRVENAFGLSKGKWRSIKMLHVRNPEIAVDHIISSFMLHNFIIMNGEVLLPEDLLADPINDNDVLGNEDFEDDDSEDEDVDEDFNNMFEDAQQRGQEKRIHIMQHLGQFQ